MPISNNILAGSGQGGGDFGDPIEQSLRFDGTTATHYLENTNITIQATSTASMWVKLLERRLVLEDTYLALAGKMVVLVM